MKVDKNEVIGGGVLVILTGKNGNRRTFVKTNQMNEFERVVTIVLPEETHGVKWETKEF